MEEIFLNSNAEKNAEKAESFTAFSGLKLLHVKKQVAKILSLIGRDGIFDEYTKHNISHINYLLSSLDWLIPVHTQERLTSADWMMIVLSIYFHDLGMLVTKDEFKNKDKNIGYTNYEKDVFEGKLGAEFRDKISKLSHDDQGRFLYQEYVRRTHAERIKYWITGENPPYQNFKLQVVEEIQKLFSTVLVKFKRDLAFICESHHLSDLDDFGKYKISQPYGPSDDEVVNLHYAALILRTADLLHITQDRTPSIEFSLINPSDPKSQEEWCKQRSVLAVRPQDKINDDGDIDANLPKDTLDVIASFEDENGFFGLIAYLNYAQQEIKQSYYYSQIAQKKYASKFEYPWRKIDDKNIEANNFEKRKFEFVLDQGKILDLLVGHTLYNDATVVIRELTQNAIDAVKLQKYDDEINGTDSKYSPMVNIIWDEQKRELSFIDNGTGMTLEIIENHLLKVGSSRYQEDTFKKKYPDFTPISKFGIGLLTCFLIANDVDIITNSGETDKAIFLRIKKVHGKYLLKYISKEDTDLLSRKHGTEVKLYVRSDVFLTDIEGILKKWILLPNCNIKLINNSRECKIGYDKASDIIKEYLKIDPEIGEAENIKVEDIYENGTSVAFALRYDENFKEWSFLKHSPREDEEDKLLPIGTCIEGIRVDFNTPGFINKHIYCIANVSGKKAPKTNVARSNIEITPDKENLLYHIYELYLQQIETELHNLYLQNGFSLSWATYEANYLLSSFLIGSRTYDSDNIIKLENTIAFNKAASNIKCLLVEENGSRILRSVNELKTVGSFWTIDCALYESADSLIKEIPSSNASALNLLNSLFENTNSNTQHIDNLLCNFDSNGTLGEIIAKLFQVSEIKIIPEQRRIDFKWTLTSERIWDEIRIPSEYYSASKFFIQLKDIEISNIGNQIAIKTNEGFFILKNSKINEYLIGLKTKLSFDTFEDFNVYQTILELISGCFNLKKVDSAKVESFIGNKITVRKESWKIHLECARQGRTAYNNITNGFTEI